MRIFHSGKRQMLAFFVPGFLLGIIYVNFAAEKYMAEAGIFSDLFLSQFADMQIDIRSYLPYLIRLRAVPLLLLAAVSFTRLRKAAAILFLLWTGFTGGVTVSSAVYGLGLKGSLLCAAALLPQFLFYIPAFMILLWYCISAPGTRWNRQKTIFVIAAMAAGIVLELWVNPELVRAFTALFQMRA